MKKITFIQAFNAMRIFLSMEYHRTKSENLGTLSGSLNLWTDKDDWKENPETFDPAAWDDWMTGVERTFQNLGYKEDPKNSFYDEELAFLCMKNYLQVFNEQFEWQDVAMLLSRLNNVQHVQNDFLWQEWLKAIKYSITETYALDVYD